MAAMVSPTISGSLTTGWFESRDKITDAGATLAKRPDGAFVVQELRGNNCSLALKFNRNIERYRIVNDGAAVQIEGAPHSFASLTELINFYSIEPNSGLPIRLVLPAGWSHQMYIDQTRNKSEQQVGRKVLGSGTKSRSLDESYTPGSFRSKGKYRSGERVNRELFEEIIKDEDIQRIVKTPSLTDQAIIEAVSSGWIEPEALIEGLRHNSKNTDRSARQMTHTSNTIRSQPPQHEESDHLRTDRKHRGEVGSDTNSGVNFNVSQQPNDPLSAHSATPPTPPVVNGAMSWQQYPYPSWPMMMPPVLGFPPMMYPASNSLAPNSWATPGNSYHEFSQAPRHLWGSPHFVAPGVNGWPWQIPQRGHEAGSTTNINVSGSGVSQVASPHMVPGCVAPHSTRSQQENETKPVAKDKKQKTAAKKKKRSRLKTKPEVWEPPEEVVIQREETYEEDVTKERHFVAVPERKPQKQEEHSNTTPPKQRQISSRTLRIPEENTSHLKEFFPAPSSSVRIPASQQPKAKAETPTTALSVSHSNHEALAASPLELLRAELGLTKISPATSPGVDVDFSLVPRPQFLSPPNPALRSLGRDISLGGASSDPSLQPLLPNYQIPARTPRSSTTIKRGSLSTGLGSSAVPRMESILEMSGQSGSGSLIDPTPTRF